MSDQDSPQLAEYASLAIAQELFQTRTLVPGRVVSYKDSPRPMATVQLAPQVRKRPVGTENVEWVVIPKLVDVPVMEFRWGPFHMRANLEKDDDIVCLVADRDIDEWLLQGGGTYRPGIALIHDINDAMVLPMLEPDSKASIRKKPGTRKLILGDTTGLKCEIELDEASSTINIKAAVSCRVDSPAVTLGTSAGAPVSSIARVTTDFVLMPIIPVGGVPTVTPLPILPGPIPGGPPSAHKVSG